jgi:hypothetical protein
METICHAITKTGINHRDISECTSKKYKVKLKNIGVNGVLISPAVAIIMDNIA